MTADVASLTALLVARGVHTATGVPCSILDPLLHEIQTDPQIDYVPAAVEGEALAIAAGAWLGGGLGVVLMQNSGLGNVVNPLSSLTIPSRIPVLLVISFRGQPGLEDAEQHHAMGKATTGLLDQFNTAHRLLSENTAQADFEWALDLTVETRRPVALLSPRGFFGASGPHRVAQERQQVPANGEPFQFGTPTESLPSRRAVLEAWHARFHDAYCVSTTGYMSRELATLQRLERHFPMQGSMGFAAAIALGMSITGRERTLCVLDGDGALWMRLGSLATIGHRSPRNFVHLVVDNGSYASTGAQATVSDTLDFSRVALATGYTAAANVVAQDGLEDALHWARQRSAQGPVLLRVHTLPDSLGSVDRPSISAAECATRLRAAARMEPRP